MTTTGRAALALAVALGWGWGAAADDAKLPGAKAFDKSVIDSLRAVHNKGAALYNEARDYPGAYRLYQGALEAVKPLLAHRPEAQKLIEDGLAAAEKEAEADRRAYLLHETIEALRKNLRVANGFQKKQPPDKKPPEPGAAPMPKGKAELADVGGRVTLAGKPLATGKLTLVSLNQLLPRVFTAEVTKGAYQFAKPIPPGKYAAMVTGPGVPEKYALASTSALLFEFAPGRNAADLALK
jgi:hypothetical protein